MSEKQLKEKLKVLFRSYRKMTPHIERELSALGITTSRHKNHIVLNVQGHSVPIGCTVSDRLIGKKIVAHIMSCFLGNSLHGERQARRAECGGENHEIIFTLIKSKIFDNNGDKL